MTTPNCRAELTAASSGYDRETCWVQTRAGAMPPTEAGGHPTVVLTMQKLLLSGSPGLVELGGQGHETMNGNLHSLQGDVSCTQVHFV